MNLLHLNTLKDLSSSKKKLISIGSLMVVIFAFFWTKSHPVIVDKSSEENLSTSILLKLESLENKLVNREQKLSSNQIEEQIAALHQENQQLIQSIKQIPLLNTSDLSQTLIKSISENKVSFSQEMSELKSTLTQLKMPFQEVHFLSKEALPFKILSIDSIQGVTVGSIQYDFKTIALEEGDSLAGWKIKALDYAKQCIELTNHNNEHVRLKTQDIG